MRKLIPVSAAVMAFFVMFVVATIDPRRHETDRAALDARAIVARARATHDFSTPPAGSAAHTPAATIAP